MAQTFSPKAESALYSYLRGHGWMPCEINPKTLRMLWKHPRLKYPWPTMAAKQLTDECYEGSNDTAHRLLRGETT